MTRHLPALLLLALATVFVPSAAHAGIEGAAEAKKALEGAIAAQDVGRVRDALKALTADPSEKSVKVLAAATAAARDLDIYGDLVEAISGMASANDAALREAVRTAAKDGDWTVRFLFVDAISAVDRPEARQGLFAAYDDKHLTVAVQAMRVSAKRKIKSAVGPLIDAHERFTKKKEAKLETEARLALGAITGESFTNAGDWRRWWQANEAAFDPATVAERKASEGGTVIRRVQERGEYDLLERLGKGDIVVVKGQMDTTEEVLDVLKLPYTLISREEAAKKLPSLDPNVVLVYNCDSIPEKKLGDREAAALATFVERGGYLFTTDWCLREALAPALKDALVEGPTTQQQPFEAKIAASRAAATHPYMRDVFPASPFEQAKMKWHFDTLCCTIKPSPRAISLVECDELGKKYGTPCVAATFRAGKGAVLHLIGHFRQQKDGAGDGFAMQQMLVNFIVEKQKFRAKGK
jgi:hypothetical protein